MGQYQPTVNRKLATRIAAQCLKAGSLPAASSILRRYADSLRSQGYRSGGGTWISEFEKTADAWKKDIARLSIFKHDGNSKLPFVGFSTLPAFTCPGAGECLKYCYSYRAWRYPAAFLRQIQNTILIQSKDLRIADAWHKLPQGITVRLYVDGDIDSMETLKSWVKLMHERSDLDVYGYSKSWHLFKQANDEGISWPTNYRLNLSNGSRHADTLYNDMECLPITRGRFEAISIDYHGVKGFAKYDDPEYHAAVRTAAKKAGIDGPVMSCPGQCGSCTKQGHACGSSKFQNVRIMIGIH